MSDDERLPLLVGIDGIDVTNHDRFLIRHENSEPARWLIAQWLSRRGHIVNIPPKRSAPKVEEWKEYVDHGDLFIQLRVEAKQRQIKFTSREDFPFKDLLVCRKDAFDRAYPKPWFFIYLNQAGSHIALVRASSSPTWTVRWQKDPYYGPDHEEEQYCAPLDVVEFYPY